jgi:hypothetical protein
LHHYKPVNGESMKLCRHLDAVRSTAQRIAARIEATGTAALNRVDALGSIVRVSAMATQYAFKKRESQAGF